MSLDPLEKKLKKLKKQYDKLPSEQNADRIMSKIIEANEEQNRVPLYEKRPYWKWASVCATLLVVFGVGWLFMQVFEQIPYSSNDSESGMEAGDDFQIFMDEDASDEEAYDSNLGNQVPSEQSEEKEQLELMTTEFVFELEEESFSIEVPNHISYREKSQEIIFYDESESVELMTIAHYENQADINDFVEQLPGEELDIHVPELPRELMGVKQTGNVDETIYIWVEQRELGYFVYTVEVHAGKQEEQLEKSIAMIHSMRWEESY
ncbi:hypothetical protein [Alkalihalobacillus pseudalcaliphilus]|uniref:hypothetical protein n=1 Tax=Alkalihalobacillus pseudalcaliphilus TaxID=79884 RepID=UPI00064D7EEE|nr:hypothetical protein [Alkalihalobacillus pseudalcaliphilus]KMK76471.1 hypothetical protein AB990_14910 [Alkalihalobacillus pseudalcaliphilus]